MLYGKKETEFPCSDELRILLQYFFDCKTCKTVRVKHLEPYTCINYISKQSLHHKMCL